MNATCPGLRGALILVVVAVLLSLSSLAFVLPRLAFERADRQVCVILDGRGFEDLAEAVGVSWDEAAARLADAGASGWGVGRLTLDELDARRVVEIVPGAVGTPFAGDGVNGLVLRLSPDAEAWRVVTTLEGNVPVERRGEYLRVYADGAVVRTAQLFWNRDRVAAMEARGLSPVHRLYNYAWTETHPNPRVLEDVGSGGLVLFDEKYALGWPDRLREAGTLLAGRDLAVGLVEFAGQFGVEDLVLKGGARAVIVHSIGDKEMEKFTADRFLPRWVRAVRERRVRAVYVRPFPADNPPPGAGTIFDRNAAYVRSIVQALADRGYRSGARPLDPADAPLGPSTAEGETAARVGLLAAVAAMVAALLVLAGVAPPVTASVGAAAALGLLSLGTLVGQSVLVGKVAALTAGIAAAAAGTLLVLRVGEARAASAPWPFVLAAAASLMGALVVWLAGGLIIHGLLAGPAFLLKLDAFSGVKLVYMAPPLIVLLVLLLDDRFRPGRTGVTWLHVAVGGAVAAAGLLYLLRSGNFSPLPASDAETGARDLLDMLLPARPRTKEFLVGYPALVLTVWALRLRDRGLVLLMALAGSVAGVSTVNSFCHVACAPDLNVLRSAMGLAVGVPLGLLLTPLLGLVRTLPGRSVVVVGYAGFGNAGDDLLLSRLLAVLTPRLGPGDEIVVPVPARSVVSVAERFGVKAVRRTCPWALLPELTRCRLLVFGGGSLFQDRSGPLSTPYYSLFALAARLFCVEERAMVGQGMGPLGGRIARELTAFAAASCDLVQVRDEGSRAALLRCGAPDPGVGADLMLWLRPEEAGLPGERRARLGVSLRPDPALDGAALDAMARALAEAAARRKERIQLLALQPEQDRPVLAALASRLPEGAGATMVDVTGETLVEEVGRCRAVVSMRYHATLAAIYTLTPLVALSYDPKTRALLDEVSWPHWLPVGEVAEPGRLGDMLTALRSEGDEAGRRLKEGRALLLRRGRLGREAFEAFLEAGPSRT